MQHVYNPAAPLPTAAPPKHLVERRLAGRQVAGNICGWAYSVPGIHDGLPTDVFPLTCGAGMQCAKRDAIGMAGCCFDLVYCPELATSCIDRSVWMGISGPIRAGIVACTDQIHPYCAEVVYDTLGFSTFVCARTAMDVERGVIGASPPAMAKDHSTPIDVVVNGNQGTPSSGPTSSAPTTPTAGSTPVAGGGAVNTHAAKATAAAGGGGSGSSNNSAAPEAGGSSDGATASNSAAAAAFPTANHAITSSATSTAAAGAAPAPVLSTGAIVAIAIAGAAVLLGALAAWFFVRRSNQKRADHKLHEAALLRQTVYSQQQMMGQMSPQSPRSVGGWVQEVNKTPEPMVTENYPPPMGTVYDDGMTAAGTVDYNRWSPRF